MNLIEYNTGVFIILFITGVIIYLGYKKQLLPRMRADNE